MARPVGDDTVRRVAPEARAVCPAGTVGTVPLGRAEDEGGAMGE